MKQLIVLLIFSLLFGITTNAQTARVKQTKKIVNPKKPKLTKKDSTVQRRDSIALFKDSVAKKDSIKFKKKKPVKKS